MSQKGPHVDIYIMKGDLAMPKYDDVSHGKYAYLEQLSMEQLEELLHAINATEEDEALLDAVTEVIIEKERKAPSGRLPDIDAAWERFQREYMTPAGEPARENEAGHGAYPAHRALSQQEPKRSHRYTTFRIWDKLHRPFINISATVMMTCLLLFGGATIAQAAGADIFGALARWTSETFHFVPAVDPEESKNASFHDEVQAALDEQGILGEFAPTWYPERFTAAETTVKNVRNRKTVVSTFFGLDTDPFYISVEQYIKTIDIGVPIFELENESTELYSSNGKAYYLYNNENTLIASWSDNVSTVFKMWGNLTVDEMKAILDSIGV